jgi:hypothetical protein
LLLPFNSFFNNCKLEADIEKYTKLSKEGKETTTQTQQHLHQKQSDLAVVKERIKGQQQEIERLEKQLQSTEQQWVVVSLPSLDSFVYFSISASNCLSWDWISDSCCCFCSSGYELELDRLKKQETHLKDEHEEFEFEKNDGYQSDSLDSFVYFSISASNCLSWDWISDSCCCFCSSVALLLSLW